MNPAYPSPGQTRTGKRSGGDAEPYKNIYKLTLIKNHPQAHKRKSQALSQLPPDSFSLSVAYQKKRSLTIGSPVTGCHRTLHIRSKAL